MFFFNARIPSAVVVLFLSPFLHSLYIPLSSPPPQSTLLQCLLGELQSMEGTVSVRGKVSYASQDQWVFSGSLRENILFGNPFNKEWYDTVIDACALVKVHIYGLTFDLHDLALS